MHEGLNDVAHTLLLLPQVGLKVPHLILNMWALKIDSAPKVATRPCLVCVCLFVSGKQRSPVSSRTTAYLVRSVERNALRSSAIAYHPPNVPEASTAFGEGHQLPSVQLGQLLLNGYFSKWVIRKVAGPPLSPPGGVPAMPPSGVAAALFSLLPGTTGSL